MNDYSLLPFHFIYLAMFAISRITREKDVFRGPKRDPFLRDGTRASRVVKAFRQYPFPVRMFGIFLMGFTLGSIIEIFACKTHLYESVMSKKDVRRHEFDEFVVDFRKNVETWQQEDMKKQK
ncbi:hypothetical protein AGDE_00399 [Angomonas deanei]|uniref:Uncharacterized protein n=1 Tax=Angomonas deanei TaxID=59799 RepID=A0A7G2BZ99_9TRYP|nr:hypothetical protein AGDE_00399 [Angomonas deanei]CAD2212760.1 hypothetical protein, conserved [Angomonas deanei]|eukprot:EPY43522.1 hypothetical protein AGDE_00399 [Angomonas deanei]